MKLYIPLVFVLLLVSLSNASGLNEQNQKITVKAIRCNEPIKIDGQLSETVWQNGNCVENFVTKDPIEGGKPSEKTEVRLAYDDEALYVVARLFDCHPDSITKQLGRKDANVDADLFGIFIDPYHDKRSGYYFGLSAGGTLLDGVMMN
ncbi:MAG: carbohydrate binding family 9 domain-containing protein, partial [Calditrichaceae bacterium]